MNGLRKGILVLLGLLSGLLLVTQLVFGQLLLSGNVRWKTPHQHTGYTAVVVVLLYLGASLPVILSLPTRRDR